MTKELAVQTERTARLRRVLWTFARRAVTDAKVQQGLVEQTEVALRHNRRLGGRDGALQLLARQIADYYQASSETPGDDEGAASHPGPGVEHSMERALMALPPFERLAVLLCDVERLNRRSACDVLGCSRGRLAFLVACGRNRLRRLLESGQA